VATIPEGWLADSSSVRVSALSGGGAVATESIPGVRSAAVGVWVRTGSRDEAAETLGISHFLEHMMFKGTARRDAREIARSLESVGSALDAYTTREYTCYQARVVDEDLPRALDVIGDCLSHSLLNPEHVEREKLVVAEEIQSYEDTPDEHIQDLVSEAVWRGHPLGTPILGTRDTVRSFTPELVRDRFLAAYHTGNMVAAVAGSLDHEVVVDLVERHLELKSTRPAMTPEPVALDYHPSDVCLDRDFAQLNLCLGTPAVGYADSGRYPLMLLNGILGGSMSSRIFQRVREDEGLAYSVFTDVEFYHDSGIFCCGLGVSPDQGKRALRLVGEEFRRLRRDGLEPGELDDMKSQFRGSLLLSLESTGARMGRLAKGLLYYGRSIPALELLDRIDAVSEEEVMALATELLRPERFTLIALGPLKEGPLAAAELLG
jgi:predicted Zn-dependent peptidase